MKKRIVLSGLLAAALTLSLTACGGDKMPEETPVPTPIQTSTPVPTPTPTPAPAAPKWGDQVFAKTFTSGDGATVLTASFTPPLIQNTAACPAGAKPRSRRLSTTPGPSVLYPTARPFRKHTVFTAPQEAVHGSTASSSGRMRSFRGMVTLHPSHAPRRPCATKSSSVSAVTVIAS